MGATVDAISRGRLDFGIGAGWHEGEHTMYGIPLYAPGERIRRLGEACEVIRLLWTEKIANFDGQYYQLKDALCEPKPVQQPHPPVTIGGSGRKRTLRTAARWAQQWNTIVDSPEQWLELKQVLAGHCASIGRDVSEITCSVNVRIGADGNLEPAVAAAAAYRDAGADLVILNLPLHPKPDSLKPLAEALGPLA